MITVKKTLKWLWTALIIFVPYAIPMLGLIEYIRSGGDLSSEYIAEHRPTGDEMAPIDWIMEYYSVMLICVILFAILSLIFRAPAKELLKMNLLIKCCQIPAYVLWFLMGALFVLTVFTMALSLLIVLLDCFTIFLSGMIATTGMIRAAAEGNISKGWAVVLSIASFVFCLDVAVAIVSYCKVKKTRV